MTLVSWRTRSRMCLALQATYNLCQDLCRRITYKLHDKTVQRDGIVPLNGGTVT